MNQLQKFTDLQEKLSFHLIRWIAFLNDNRNVSCGINENTLEKIESFKILLKNIFSHITDFCIKVSTAATDQNQVEIISVVESLLIVLNLFENELINAEISGNYGGSIPVLDFCTFSLNNLMKVLDINFFHSGSISDDLMVCFNEYQCIAKALVSSTDEFILDEIKKLLYDMAASVWNRSMPSRANVSFNDFPYVAVVGPSFMGKTQLAFTLAQNQPVIYLNFYEESTQPVYKLFNSISSVMSFCIESDLNLSHIRSSTFGPGTNLLLKVSNLNIEYKSLGLLYELINRGTTFNFDSESNWMSYYINLESFTFSKMSIPNFYEKFATLKSSYPNVNQPIIFIDEFIKEKTVIFLRNLSRAISFPCILASTNAKVSNMITYAPKCSRGSRTVWCHVISRLPPVSMEGILKVISIPRYEIACSDKSYGTFNGKNRLFLNEFITPKMNDISGLLNYIEADLTDIDKNVLDQIIDLIKNQSKTCLQGIVYLAFESLSMILTKFAENQKLNDVSVDLNLWENLTMAITKNILIRKETLSRDSSLYFSLQSFSLSPIQSNLPGVYDEGFASISINDHLYYFGHRPDPNDFAFITTLVKNSERCFLQNNDNYVLKSYFSQFHEDIFTHISVWKFIGITLVSNSSRLIFKTTIAQILKKFDNNSYKIPINVEALANDFNLQENLAFWAIANASHQNISGHTDGIVFLKEFAIQVQIIDDYLASQIDVLRNLIPKLPENLHNFLAGISCPYYIPQLNLPNYFLLENFIKFGVCKRLPNSSGFDISFEINLCASNILSLGFVECKNLKNSVSRQLIKPYILKSINGRIPLTIFLVRTAGTSLRSVDDFNKFIDGSNSRTLSYLDMISEARADSRINQDFNLNIYSLIYLKKDQDNVRIKGNTDINFTSPLGMIFIQLHETQNPDGVFIIIESNL